MACLSCQWRVMVKIFFNQINFVKSSITLAPLPKRTTIVVFFRIYFRKSIDFGNNQPEC